MTKRIKHITTFLLVLVIVLEVIENTAEKLLHETRIDNIGKINALMNHEIDDEVVIWGASTAYNNFDPILFEQKSGLSCFNMGVDGTNIDQYYGLTREHLSYSENCKYAVIVLEIRSSLSKRSQYYNLHNWAHHFEKENIYENLKDIDPYFSFKCRYIPYYRVTAYDKHGFSYIKKNLFSNKQDYLPRKGCLLHDSINIYKSRHTEQFSHVIDARAKKKLFETIKGYKRRSIMPIIVVSPCYSDGLDLIQNINEFYEVINECHLNGAKILDYLKPEFHNDPTCFKDNTHLNAKGARILTEMLAKDIMAQASNIKQP